MESPDTAGFRKPQCVVSRKRKSLLSVCVSMCLSVCVCLFLYVLFLSSSLHWVPETCPPIRKYLLLRTTHSAEFTKWSPSVLLSQVMFINVY